jgi:hypothetical protein
MTAHPFLTLPIRQKKDAITARHRARQVASLLHFDGQQQACVAAAAFAVVCQALAVVGRCLLCFQIEENQLHVYVRTSAEHPECSTRRISCGTPVAGGDARALLRLVKPLPEDRGLAEADLAWLVHNTEETPAGLFEEVVKQNQEILSLLHELAASQRSGKESQSAQPNAA